MAKKKFLPCFADLVDRLSIHLLKEVKIPEIKETIIKEKFDILHDLDIDIKEKKYKTDCRFDSCYNNYSSN